MRVALVGAHGARARLAYLAEELSQRSLGVTLYTSRAVRADAADRSFDVVCGPAASGAVLDDAAAAADADVADAVSEMGRFLVERWARDRPDVVHADGWSHGLAAQLAAGRLHLPTVQALPQLSSVVRRRQGRDVGSPARARFERLLARGATRAAVSCTEDVLELAKLGCPRNRVTVLPYGVDLAAFTPRGPAGDRAAGQRIVVLASDLLPHRGLDDLVHALARTRGAELVIAGGPTPNDVDQDPAVARLREIAARHAVAEKVLFLGRIKSRQVPALLRSADLLVCPSWYEPFSTSVVEAMACGIPVIASEAGGMVDSVVHGVTGLLVPPRNPRQLAVALNEVLRAGALRSGMGLAGKARATACYSWQRVAAEAHILYERALDPRSAERGRMAAAN